MSVEPSLNEEAYFAKVEALRLKKILEEKHIVKTQAENEALKALHFMHCPKCGQKMMEIEYKTVMIDQCAECAGIYLDKGEIDQLLKLDEKFVSRFAKIFLGS